MQAGNRDSRFRDSRIETQPSLRDLAYSLSGRPAVNCRAILMRPEGARYSLCA